MRKKKKKRDKTSELMSRKMWLRIGMIINLTVMDPLKTLTNDLVVFMDSSSSTWQHSVKK